MLVELYNSSNLHDLPAKPREDIQKLNNSIKQLNKRSKLPEDTGVIRTNIFPGFRSTIRSMSDDLALQKVYIKDMHDRCKMLGYPIGWSHCPPDVEGMPQISTTGNPRPVQKPTNQRPTPTMPQPVQRPANQPGQGSSSQRRTPGLFPTVPQPSQASTIQPDQGSSSQHPAQGHFPTVPQPAQRSMNQRSAQETTTQNNHVGIYY